MEPLRRCGWAARHIGLENRAFTKGGRRSAAIDAAGNFGPHSIVKQLQIVASALRRRR
jgi:hypothetical protein